MRRIEELDKKLTTLFRNFNEIAKELDIPVICPLSDESMIKELQYPGIYIIEVNTSGSHKDFKSWVKAFQRDWDHLDFRNKFTPSTKKIRIKCHNTLDEWLPHLSW